MVGCVTEYQTITHAQYLDLVHSQFGTLYDLFPYDPRLSIDLTSYKPWEVLPVDGIIGLVTQTFGKDSSNQKYVWTTVSNSLLNPSQNPIKNLQG